ncbi:MAG: peptidase M75 [Myxococcales bacterium]|nr:peptidase M75 [Myxococcales bacterium]
MRTAVPILLSLFALPTLVACDDGGPLGPGFTDRQVVADFADQVVIPTYALLDARARALDAAVVALAADPDATTLAAAQQAWVETRRPWEQSEGFLFGPVSAQGFDPAMDSWPVERNDLDAVIASTDELTAAYLHNLPETQKGFHTLEYLLFGPAHDRVATDLAARELAYLAGTSRELVTITTGLAASWTTGDRPYRDVFVSAGAAGNTAYPSLDAAAQEILVGMSGICDEVANGKIADPYDAHDPDLVESQFSYNSLADFADNLRSVEHAYTGDVPAAGTTGRGLDEVVRAVDPALDARFRAELAAAIAAIGAIPPPFRDAITTPSAYPAIAAAQAAVRTVQTTIDGDLTQAVR